MLTIGSSVAAPKRVAAGAQQAALPRPAPACRARLAVQLPWCPVPTHLARIHRHTVQAAASAAAAALPEPAQQPCAQQVGVFEALRKCRSLFSCMAFCAIYAFLSWGSAPGAPFASAALAMGEAPASGAPARSFSQGSCRILSATKRIRGTRKSHRGRSHRRPPASWSSHPPPRPHEHR